MTRLAVDFGTSNTAAALPGVGVLTLDGRAQTLPTALFYDPYDASVCFGTAAVDALIEGREGRFLRALKSVLGTPLLREARVLGGKRTTLLQVVAEYLRHVKTQAEAQHGPMTRALSGRPVRFHSKNPDYNAQAQVDLAEAYGLAGFADVQFLPEPEAAALASGGVAQGYGLVVDIGGGTSDYAVFHGVGAEIQVIANYGIRLGGTDFDRLLNIDLVMPHLGLGSMIRDEFGSGKNAAPRALFHDLATWEKIPFQYTAQTLRDVRRMARLAEVPKAWARLDQVLEMELAHEIAHAVERAKIAANQGRDQGIDLGFVERGLAPGLGLGDLARVLTPQAQMIADAAQEAVRQANLAPQDITRVVMVGGSGLMQVIEAAVRTALPNATLSRAEAFTAIVDGLAIAAERMD